MYDKSVRRRRITVALLVACSLLLLTAYFGESAGGGLHSVQRGVLEVVSPIQDGASRALKPFRPADCQARVLACAGPRRQIAICVMRQ